MIELNLIFNGEPITGRVEKKGDVLFNLADITRILKMVIVVPKWLEDEFGPESGPDFGTYSYVFDPECSGLNTSNTFGYFVSKHVVHRMIQKSLELAPLPKIHAFNEWFESSLIAISETPLVSPDDQVGQEDQTTLKGQTTLEGQQDQGIRYMEPNEVTAEIGRVRTLMDAFDSYSNYLEGNERARVIKHIFDSLIGEPAEVQESNGSKKTSPAKEEQAQPR